MRTAESAATDVSIDLDALRAVLREHPVQLAILFGSHATGTTHPGSDIDLAVAFDGHRPSDPGYNDVFLALSVDLSDALETDAVDLVDLRTVSPALAEAIFGTGVLLVGEQDHAAALRRQLAADDETRSPRERLDTALARIDEHLRDGESGTRATAESGDEP